MKTDIIAVTNQGGGIETALQQAELVAAYKQLNTNAAMQLRLLTEETMGMMRAIAGTANGSFWIEDEDDCFAIHLVVETVMDSVKREQLLAASTSGKNEASRGLMGKIRDLFDRIGENGEMPLFDSPIMLGTSAEMYGSYSWSLDKYREALVEYREKRGDAAEEAWDELEKSVVANVADEIKVSLRGNKAEMIIEKRFA